eukprot:GHVU01170746.1.p2 GENE.GHVU01170746.1~~GHVU01170746.1.p2  ORF type:complete len:192 (+),score=9.23 GHVU01170746.1:241-816(+)
MANSKGSYFLGTAAAKYDVDELEAYDKPLGSTKPWDQVVTDDKGRRRFHGSFTGGFSAGYFNTVDTPEGNRMHTRTRSHTREFRCLRSRAVVRHNRRGADPPAIQHPRLLACSLACRPACLRTHASTCPARQQYADTLRGGRRRAPSLARRQATVLGCESSSRERTHTSIHSWERRPGPPICAGLREWLPA